MSATRRLAALAFGSILVLLAAAPLAAATFHVAPPPAGSDVQPGTAGQPWATLQHAVDQVGPGDVVLVHAGTYAGARIGTSGTSGAPIALRAAPGEAVLLDAPGAQAAHDGVIEIEDFGGTVGWWTVEGFEIDGGGVARSGIDLRDTTHVTVRGNEVYGSVRTGIFTAFSDDPLIEGNLSHHNCEHGVYHSNSGDRPVIRGNRLWANAAAGLHMNADLSQGGDGVITGAVVEANRIWDNGAGGGGCGFGGGAGINMDGVVDSVVRNNLLWNAHASGIALYRIDGAVCSQGNLILHNTVIAATDGRWALTIQDFADPPDGCPDNLVVNNVLWSSHGFRGAISLDQAHPPGFASRHNLVEGVFSVDTGDTTLSFAQWQALGHGTGSVEIVSSGALAALFTDLAGADFHLAPGSDAIDAGEPRPDVPADIDGTPRPRGTGWDAGAYEAGELLFADGFESGDTSAWSAAVP
jgi:parallel beta-helix repeat protein